MKPLIKILLVLLCLCLLPFPVIGANNAANITQDTGVTATGYSSAGFLTDGDIDTYRTSNGDVTITLENKDGIAGIYLLFDLEYGKYTIRNNSTNATVTAGEHAMLHEYVDLAVAFGAAPTSVTLEFSSGKVRLSEIYAFSQGVLPNWVQNWHKPLEDGADLVLFATHGDDDQLFFAGLLPYYAGQLGYRVQVVYLTDHRNLTNSRTHEMLNGLWNVGVTAYPVFGGFDDFRIDDLQETYDEYASRGTSKEELEAFVVEQLRRFKPLVAIGHDLKGEYGHGMHMVYADLLTTAAPKLSDTTYFPDSAEKYGIWTLPKLYLHLYKENAISIDYDKPLSKFDGMTAFAVSQKYGYPCHKSQQWTWFTHWINGYDNEITKASQIKTYNPCQFGLYYTTVGEDTEKTDFFENIITYAEQERLEEERLEQERLEQERLEQERLEQERLEQERLEQERLEQERLEQEKQIQEQKAKRTEQLIWAFTVLAVLILALIMVLRVLYHSKKRHKRK